MELKGSEEESGRKWFMEFFITVSIPRRRSRSSSINSGILIESIGGRWKGRERENNDSMNFPNGYSDCDYVLWLICVFCFEFFDWFYFGRWPTLPARSPTDTTNPTTNHPPDQYWISSPLLSKQKHQNPLWKLLWSPCTTTTTKPLTILSPPTPPLPAPLNARLNRAPDVDQLQIHSDCESFVDDKKGLLAPSSYLSIYPLSILHDHQSTLPKCTYSPTHPLTVNRRPICRKLNFKCT